MNTPICDFVKRYACSEALRLHMPGHKGEGMLGVEALDITEISGADSLYEAGGIIRESEQNASSLFSCETFYSTEGSSLCIRAMLHLAMLHGRQQGRRPLVYAARNAHKTFMSAAALLDLDVEWIVSGNASYLACPVGAEELNFKLETADEKAFALYITSPDYLGNTADIAALADVCHRHDVLLLVDNAHGAYLRFLQPSRHPMDLGADMCCDSAHKTLPVLTGGAYLHLSDTLARHFQGQVKHALALFGSTSPSYLILQSLDAANRILASGYVQRLEAFAKAIQACRQALIAHGYSLIGNEPLKITLAVKSRGYTGTEFAEILRTKNIECEFADPDYIVMMLAPEIGTEGLEKLQNALLDIPARAALTEVPPAFRSAQRVFPIREAMLSPSEVVPLEKSIGRILSSASVGCPPAVPILICGERIDEHAIACFQYYGIESISVIREA